METGAKTDIEIIQELLSMYAARKEACEKLLNRFTSGDFQSRLQQCLAQTDRFTQALLDELSAHGDAVLADVDRSDPYLTLWKQTSPRINTMEEATAKQTFITLEHYLQNYYGDVIATRTGLPETFEALLHEQQAELSK